MLKKIIFTLYTVLGRQAPLDHTTGKLLAPQSRIEPGIYQHYKGGNYQVLCIAQNSESLKEEVVYQSLYGDLRVWTRPLGMFKESVEHQGQLVPRFKKIADTSEAEKYIQIKAE